ncbi:MAG: cell wall-active antibiotics response protein [Thermoanaerobaculia bacterium]|nr:MAG: cell wall-active antibiotics response protein [Thermoanaerobaculia bacterium]
MLPEAGAQRGGVSVRLVLGLLIVALGGIFLAGNLGWLESRELLHQFWPTAFVVVGLVVLFQPGCGPARWWGLVWIVAGAWIWADRKGWIQVDFWEVFFPAVLLLVGGSLVWRSLAGGRARPAARPPGDDPEAYLRSFAVMAGNELRSVSRGFRGADLGAFMGAVVLDLTSSKMEGDQAVIDTYALWGGIEIRVPPDWMVTGKVFPLMGAFEDKTRPASGEPAKHLVVRGVVVMGGIEVKN